MEGGVVDWGLMDDAAAVPAVVVIGVAVGVGLLVGRLDAYWA